MKRRSRIAVAQMSSAEDKAANLRTAVRLIEQAARAGADLVALPEMFNCYGRPRVIVAQAEPIPGPTSQALCDVAARAGVTLVAGSLCEQNPHDPQRGWNTSLLIGPDGAVRAAYRKHHLFDIELPGQVVSQESSWLTAGDDLVAADAPIGRLGLAICYDLRFPELFRRLVDAGCELVAIPSAFTLATGRDHWEVLLRARAIENQLFVIAPNQCGQHPGGMTSFGRSMIVDPWGTVLAMAADGEGLITAEVDLDRVSEIRARLPALRHRRLG